MGMSGTENHRPTAKLRTSVDELMAAGKVEEARALLQPEMDGTHRASFITQYAVALYLLNEEDAVDWLEMAVEEGDQPVMALVNLGTARESSNRLDEAQSFFEKALSFDPMSSDALIGLGRVHYQKKDYERALSAFRRAHTFNRDAAQPLWHLIPVFEFLDEMQDVADTYRLLFQVDDSEKVFTALLESCRRTASLLLERFALTYVQEHANQFSLMTLLAKYYLKNSRAVEAVRLLASVDDPPGASGDWTLTKAVAFHDLGFSEKANLLLMTYLKTREPTDLTWSPFLMLQHYLPQREQADIARLHHLWGKHQPKERAFTNRQNRARRIAFVSGDFGNHPVGFFCVPLFEGLRKRGFDIYLFDTRPKNDPTQALLYSCASSVVNIADRSDDALLKEIRDLSLDIALDLSGHTRGARLSLFARRIANYQMTAYGYVNTTGLKAMDGILSDPYQILQSEEKSYSETVLRLPFSYIVYQRPDWFPEIRKRDRTKPITFGSLNRAAKLGPHTIERFSNLLLTHPNSRVILAAPGLDNSYVQQDVAGRFASKGVDAEQIIFRGGADHRHYLENYNDIDIAIDTAPYSGGLTTCEALAMGVPVVTVPGTTMASRHSFGHLTNAGYPQWSFESEEDLLDGSHELVGNVLEQRLDKVMVRDQVLASHLCDVERYVDDICALFESLTR